MPKMTLKYSNKTITLPVNPQEVSWSYSLKTNTIKTYRGVVVQVLGYSISDLQVSGQLPYTAGDKNRFDMLDRFEDFITRAMDWQQGVEQGKNEERFIELSLPVLRPNSSGFDFGNGYTFRVLLGGYPNITRDIVNSVPTYSLVFKVIEYGGGIKALTEQDIRYKSEIDAFDYHAGVMWSKNKYNNPEFTEAVKPPRLIGAIKAEERDRKDETSRKAYGAQNGGVGSIKDPRIPNHPSTSVPDTRTTEEKMRETRFR